MIVTFKTLIERKNTIGIGIPASAYWMNMDGAIAFFSI